MGNCGGFDGAGRSARVMPVNGLWTTKNSSALATQPWMNSGRHRVGKIVSAAGAGGCTWAAHDHLDPAEPQQAVGRTLHRPDQP